MKRKPGRPRKPLDLSQCGDVLTAEETARVLRCNVKTVYLAVHTGTLPALRLGARVIRVPKWQVERLLQSGGGATTEYGAKSATGGR